MRYGSVCSGIEAASVAWKPLGWEAAWFSEIEPFPSAVLAHHYPGVPNLGDMTALPERIRGLEVEAPDLLCGGTPCQAFSVAGLRLSLADDRGNLSLTFCEVADAIDEVRAAGGKPASIIFWENVPGVLSTKDNAFGCFLGALAGCDAAVIPDGRWTHAGVVAGPKRTVAWRIFDAQHFGLAQRRKRVFVVASAREGFDPSAVLFEWEGVRRDTAPSRAAGEDPTGGVIPSVAGSLDTECGGGKLTHQSVANGRLVVWWDGGHTAASLTTRSHSQFMPDKANFESVIDRGVVRRLTPVECERLMGFPDGYTAIPYRGRDADNCPDGARYKALGNSWAVPVVRWIGERINKSEGA